VVLLSTHIVTDVSDLCRNMAILAGGKVNLSGKPLELMKKLEGSIWKKFVTADELEALSKQLTVIAVRRVAGQRLLHVFSESKPQVGEFEPVTPDLEDVYFQALATAQKPQQKAA